ncbi:MAG: protein-L-isoaspartate O-methyltransferase, partial [Boseongicola sp. SB0664_bin_43]|nr:protein-L-isoaspartate O-methyltransferase [Boseongicola sp. SB0664_bin_43]
IEGAVQDIPGALVDQLKVGGRIVAIFLEGALGTARVGYKDRQGVSWRFAFNAAAPVLPGFEKQREFAL